MCVHVFVRISFETVTTRAKKIAFFWGVISVTVSVSDGAAHSYGR
jgi:hypothetical protein